MSHVSSPLVFYSYSEGAHTLYFFFIKYTITSQFVKAKLDINNQISSDKKQLIFKSQPRQIECISGQRCDADLRNHILIKTLCSFCLFFFLSKATEFEHSARRPPTRNTTIIWPF